MLQSKMQRMAVWFLTGLAALLGLLAGAILIILWTGPHKDVYGQRTVGGQSGISWGTGTQILRILANVEPRAVHEPATREHHGRSWVDRAQPNVGVRLAEGGGTAYPQAPHRHGVSRTTARPAVSLRGAQESRVSRASANYARAARNGHRFAPAAGRLSEQDRLAILRAIL
jgi:hypothetical protein